MFTGIVEATGTVIALKKEKSNIHFSINAPFLKEIKVDQSIAHNGVCLTVVGKTTKNYTVTAIAETLSKTNLKTLKTGNEINLERCMKADGRFDGHIVQGHVDCTAKVHSIEEKQGSWMFRFEIKDSLLNGSDGLARVQNLIVEKGSICINGVSLTVVDCITKPKGAYRHKPITFFSVAIIPYTFDHTNFHSLKVGGVVNIEFDIIGKYVAKMVQTRSK